MLTFYDQYHNTLMHTANLRNLARQTANHKAVDDLNEAFELIRAAVNKMLKNGLAPDTICPTK